ncbi:hypothetical protein [Deinococcus sp.]|uniref:hypothetical protein n=1 Tax=Deinococcus sp. TaxID=47478 RepID=UPI0025F05BDA|nr:hypothetical protein [Deinococcus sp.]
MNRLTPQKAALFELTHNLRSEILAALQGEDLSFSLGAQTLTLRQLLTEQGQIQASYTRLFETLELTFDASAPGSLSTVPEFTAWFTRLDADMWAALCALSNEQLDQPVQRGSHAVPLGMTFYTYRESVFIFAAKASVYLRALGRELPKQVRGFVG